MNPASRSLYWFSFYPLSAGLTMVLVPQLPLGILNFPVEGLDWIRMLGVVTTIVGYYYWQLGRTEVIAFARYTVHGRTLIPLVFVAMVLAFDMPWIYVLLTAVDLAGGLWTWSALKSMQRPVWSAA